MSFIKAGLVVFMIFWTFGCTQNTKKNTPDSESENNSEEKPDGSNASGKELAIKYCQGCHLFPEPELLDKHTWVAGVLPNMGWRMGIREKGTDPYADLIPEEKKIIHSMGVFPETPIITKAEWQKIVTYYETEAPGVPLSQKDKPIVSIGMPLFTTKQIKLGDKPLPQTTLLKYDNRSSQLYVGDAQNVLYILDKKFQMSDSWVIESAPTEIDFPAKSPPRLLTIGIFAPSDQKKGRLASLDTASVLPENGVFIESLQRPVHFAAGDLNMDGKEDVVICEFGNYSGKLSWFDGMKPSKENILKAFPGARKVEIGDFNNDKKRDVMVLMSQAWEQVSIFYNQGKGKFEEKKVLSFPSVYGVSYFDLVDFNKDGFQDILLTNGDNWDFSPIKKNYHGIRLYLNDGKYNFKEVWFYPMYGASKALAKDFDKDGDLDIAAIAFYAETENPGDGFVYLSNEGNLHFKPYSTPEAALGKWLTMEAADLDRDGDTDIVLGSYFHTIGELTKIIAKGVETFPQLLILTNNKK